MEFLTDPIYSNGGHGITSKSGRRGKDQTDLRDELKRIDRPALIVHGTADESAPIDLTGRPTSKLLPHGELRVYEGAPRGVSLTHIGQLNAELLRFVRA